VIRFFMTLLLAAALVAALACAKKIDAPLTPPPSERPMGMAPVDAEGAAPAMPPPVQADLGLPPKGSDGDKKRIAALGLEAKIQGNLANLSNETKDMSNAPTGEKRQVKGWKDNATPARVHKLLISKLDGAGIIIDRTEMFFDDKDRLAFVRAADGLFIFDQERLALWLERDERLKRGLKPAKVAPRVEELLKDAKEGKSKL